MIELDFQKQNLVWILLNRAPTSTQLHLPPPSTIHLHPAPSTSTQLHPAPSISTQLISTSTQLHPPPPSSFQPPASSLQHPQHYLNQNIALNWAISPNLDQKMKSSLFWLKIGTHGILRVLIPNPDIDFWDSHHKIYFWANLGPKSQRCLFCLKIGTHGISRMVILIPTLVFWISNLNFLFGQIWNKKVKVVHFNRKLAQMASWKCRFQIWT